MSGLTVPVGPGAILASYDENKNSLALNGSAAPSGDTAKQYAIGYTYSLSKQTDLYASYAHISNGSGTDFAVGSSTDSFSGVAGQSSSGMAIGMRHMF
jgi:predicted porin